MSSLSTTSDGSDTSQQSVMNLLLEQAGTVTITEEEKSASSVSASGNFLSVLLGGDQLYLAEFRLRPENVESSQPHRTAVVELPGTEDKKKYREKLRNHW